MVIRRGLVAWFALFGLGCAHLDAESRAQADGSTSIMVITTELEPSVRDELGTALADRVIDGGFPVAVSYDADGLQLVPGCRIPLSYEWMGWLEAGEVHDSDEALFVVAESGRSDAFVRLDRDASVRFRTQRWAALPDDELLPDPLDEDACTAATHVIREFMLGVSESDDSEALLGFWIEPLSDREQQRRAAHHRRKAGLLALQVTTTALVFTGLAVVCVMDPEQCRSDEDSNERSLPIRSRSSPSEGTELGRTRRVQVETGAGGFVLRF